MQIAICDDEQLYRDEAFRYCKEALGNDDITYSIFSSADEFFASETLFDFLFLDIEMPGMDGIHVKEELEKRKSQARIIFMTTHRERMIEAFGENVIGFLHKPIEKDAFRIILKKMQMFYARKKIEWEDSGKFFSVSADAIDYVEAQDKYTCLATQEDNYLVRRTLKEWEKVLPEDDFCRVNRSYLVNLKLLKKMSNMIVLGNGKVIRLSRKEKTAIEEKYKAYIRKKAGEM